MNSRIRVGLYGMMIVLLALASAFSVIPARADDGAPPPPAGGASPTTSTPTVISQASSTGTDVVVVNNVGHKVPLASQEAAKIVAAGDPMWCPTGVVPGSAKCSPAASNTSFQLVITWLGTQTKGRAGVIWIEQGYNSSVIDPGIHSFTLDGAIPNLTLFAPYSLTINGGWTGSRAVLNPKSPSVFYDASLSIVNWKNAVTLNNITVENVLSTPSPGLKVTTIKNIVLNNIDAVSNIEDGADLDNCYAVMGSCTGSGTVSVNDSTFNYNTMFGLVANSNRAITAKGITAVYNQGGKGVLLDNSNTPVDVTEDTGTIAQPVRLTGINNFNFNGEDGLMVLSRGVITLGNVTAINNKTQGVYLDNCRNNSGSGLCYYDYLNSRPVGYTVAVNGTNNISGNGANGLTIWATGTIAVSNLIANDNGGADTGIIKTGYGAYLDNHSAILTNRAISLTGVNTFTGNGSTGLWVNSKGTVRVSYLIANNNGRSGWSCSTGDACNGLEVSNSAGFALTGYGIFANNVDYGLQVMSLGTISLTNLDVYGNDGVGAYIDNCQLTTSGYCAGHGNFALNGTNNIFTTNGSTGLDAIIFGSVTLTNVMASYNGTKGAAVLPAGSGVFVMNCLAAAHTHNCLAGSYAVTLRGINNFSGNYVNGLAVYTLGPITMNEVTATSNTTGSGILAVTSVGRITITCGSIYINGSNGLYLSTANKITLKGVYSGLNGGVTPGVPPYLPDYFGSVPVIVRACPLP